MSETRTTRIAIHEHAKVRAGDAVIALDVLAFLYLCERRVDRARVNGELPREAIAFNLHVAAGLVQIGDPGAGKRSDDA